jgi:Tol biopolymer transport system component
VWAAAALLAAGCQVQRHAAPVGVELLEVRGVGRATDRAALSPVAWAPDGRRFAYGGRDGVWVHRLGDAAGAKIAPGDVVTAVAWSGPADTLAVVDRGALWTMRPDGSARRRIGVPGVVTRAVWAPGGDRLALIVHVPSQAGAPGHTQLWWTGPDGSIVRQVLWGPPERRAVALHWYPDALYLFVGLAADGEAAVEWWRVRIAYPDFQRLPGPPAPALDAALAPTGEWITYVAATASGQRAYAVRPDGSGRHPVSADVRRIAGLAWSPHGDKIAYGLLIDERVAEVFVSAAAVAAASGSPGRPVATHRVEFPDPAIELSLAWAPDEAHLAFGTNTGAFAGPVWLVRFGPR